MIVGTVPLYNIAAVLILSFTGPDAKGFDKESLLKSLKDHHESDHYQYRPGYVVQRLPDQLSRDHLEDHQQYRRVGNPIGPDRPRCGFEGKKALKLLAPTGVATVLKLVIWPALFLPLAVYFGFTGEKLVAILIMLGSPTTVSCYIMAKNMNHEEL